MKNGAKEFSRSSIHLINKYFFVIIILALLVISFLILKPFLIALISGFILAYLILPLHKQISKKINIKLSAFLCTLLILSLILIPLFFILYGLITQISIFNNFNSFLAKFPSLADNLDLFSLKDKTVSFMLNIISSAISYLPYLVISTFITLLSVYYILIAWKPLSKKIESLIPFKDKSRISKEISEITNNIIHGYLLIALLEFIVALIGFYLSGVKAFLLLPALIAILAFIPGLGPGVIYVPTAAYYFLNQNYVAAIGVLITGLIIGIVIETLLLGKIVGSKSKIHPLIFLVGVLGGVPLFGLFGFIIGPLVLVYSIKLIQELSERE